MNCCKKNCKDSCYTVNIGDIDKSLIAIGTKSMELEVLNSRNINYGYECENCEEIEGTLDKLGMYSNILENSKKSISSNRIPCLCPEDLQILLDKIISITGKDCGLTYSLLEEDVSEKDSWVLINPKCVSYEDWEKASFKFCKDIQLDIVAEKGCLLDLDVEFSKKDMCNLTLSIERGILSKEITTAASVYKKAFELDIDFERSKDQCKIDVKLLREIPNCDIDIKFYKELINRKVSIDIIREVYKCNAELIIERDTVYFKNELMFCPLEKLSAKPKTELTIEKLMSDYGKS